MIKMDQTALRERQLPLVEQDIVVRRRQGLPTRPKADLQILSGVRSGGRNYDECMADGGFWQCSGEAVSCYCVDNGTGDWD